MLAALRRQLPDEEFLYLGDTARLPYGIKSPSTVQRYASMAAGHLVSQGVKALVIACNTASAFALSKLREQFAPLPVFGVVEPGAAAAAVVADASGVLVLATESTIRGGAYQRALTARLPHTPIYGRACPMWVTLAEQGPQEAAFTQTVLRHELRGYVEGGPHTLLLGCTHFPVFREHLQQIVASGTRIVDSAETTAETVHRALQELGLLRAALAEGSPGHAPNRYLATDGAQRFIHTARHFMAHPPTEVEIVDL